MNYTIIDKEINIVFKECIDFVPVNNERFDYIPEPYEYTENFVKPRFNFETNEFYESASDEEIIIVKEEEKPELTREQIKEALVLNGKNSEEMVDAILDILFSNSTNERV
jgi:hypothetical protein